MKRGRCIGECLSYQIFNGHFIEKTSHLINLGFDFPQILCVETVLETSFYDKRVVDTGKCDAGIHRFNNKFIGAKFESFCLEFNGIAGSQNDDGNIFKCIHRLSASQNFESINPRHYQIK